MDFGWRRVTDYFCNPQSVNRQVNERPPSTVGTLMTVHGAMEHGIVRRTPSHRFSAQLTDRTNDRPNEREISPLFHFALMLCCALMRSYALTFSQAGFLSEAFLFSSSFFSVLHTTKKESNKKQKNKRVK